MKKSSLPTDPISQSSQSSSTGTESSSPAIISQATDSGTISGSQSQSSTNKKKKRRGRKKRKQRETSFSQSDSAPYSMSLHQNLGYETQGSSTSLEVYSSWTSTMSAAHPTSFYSSSGRTLYPMGVMFNPMKVASHPASFSFNPISLPLYPMNIPLTSFPEDEGLNFTGSQGILSSEPIAFTLEDSKESKSSLEARRGSLLRKAKIKDGDEKEQEEDTSKIALHAQSSTHDDSDLFESACNNSPQLFAAPITFGQKIH